MRSPNYVSILYKIYIKGKPIALSYHGMYFKLKFEHTFVFDPHYDVE